MRSSWKSKIGEADVLRAQSELRTSSTSAGVGCGLVFGRSSKNSLPARLEGTRNGLAVPHVLLCTTARSKKRRGWHGTAIHMTSVQHEIILN